MTAQLRLAEQDQTSLVATHGGVVSRDSKVCFLVNGQNETLDTLRASNLASVRMRLCVAAEALLSLGASVELADAVIDKDVTHLYVSKPDFYSDRSRSKRWVAMIHEFLIRGGYLIVDFSDNHLAAEGPLKNFYSWVLPKSHKVICNSRYNADVVRTYSKALVEVIEDPLECPILAPSAPPSLTGQRKRTLMWFGHASNLSYLIDFLVNEFRPEMPVRLICLTNIHPIPDQVSQQLTDHASSTLEICFIEWSQDAMVRAAKISDACILPAGERDPRKMGASANRLLTSLALGLPTMAGMIPAYEPLSDFFLPLNKSIFEDFCSNLSEHRHTVSRAQRDVLPQFSRESVKKKWRNFLSEDLPLNVKSELPPPPTGGKHLSDLLFCWSNSGQPSTKISTYFPNYVDLFAGWRGKPLTFLETGVLGGGSLFMWREWFGPQARIIGVDMNPTAERWRDEGFEIYIGDQGDPNFWQTLLPQIGEIDIFLDDGGHQSFQQIVSVDALIGHMNRKKGLIVVEDTHTSMMADFSEHGPHSFLEYAKAASDFLTQRMRHAYPQRISRSDNSVSTEKMKNISSVQFFSGMVAFHVDPQKALQTPEVVWNGARAQVDDFRYLGASCAEVDWPDLAVEKKVLVRGRGTLKSS